MHIMLETEPLWGAITIAASTNSGFALNYQLLSLHHKMYTSFIFFNQTNNQGMNISKTVEWSVDGITHYISSKGIIALQFGGYFVMCVFFFLLVLL